MALDLFGLGLQVVGAHQFSHHQTQAHTTLGLRPKHIVRDRRFVGVLDATLLQVGAGRLDHAIKLGLDAGPGQLKARLANQGVHHRLLVTRHDAGLHLALQITPNVGAQAFDRGLSDAQ